MNNRKAQIKAFERLLTIMDDLREQCPWDRKQTLESLRPLTIEETYELTDAIIDNDLEEVKKELGDVLLHIVFYAKIGSEKQAFDIADIANGICEKLINRHPHIYGDTEVKDEKEVAENWEKIKMKEGRKSVLEGVPKSLPALIKAERIQQKAAGVGFDWDKKEDVVKKVEEELEELKQELKSGNKKSVEAEFGDFLFSLINYARFINVSPENALERTNKKFTQRFQYIEKQTYKNQKNLQDLSLEEMDELWEEAKRLETKEDKM